MHFFIYFVMPVSNYAMSIVAGLSIWLYPFLVYTCQQCTLSLGWVSWVGEDYTLWEFGCDLYIVADINSRFVCKGPIHKLLNQLATRFECLDSWAVNDGSQNRKRSRSQAYPAYILNLICPRSLYDLTFEPSKTYVEFKVIHFLVWSTDLHLISNWSCEFLWICLF